jgi:hypothetical protein
MACPPPWPWTIGLLTPESAGYSIFGTVTRVKMGEAKLRLTGEHGMGCIADQDESVLVPLGNRPSSHELPELDIPGFPASGL